MYYICVYFCIVTEKETEWERKGDGWSEGEREGDGEMTAYRMWLPLSTMWVLGNQTQVFSVGGKRLSLLSPLTSPAVHTFIEHIEVLGMSWDLGILK